MFDVQRLAVHDGPGLRTVVFLKGCPLRCAWCHNPESQRARPEVFFNPDLCLGCYAKCTAACPHGAIRPAADLVNRARCRGEGRCADACPTEALRLAGQPTSVAEVMATVERDRPFLETSGGGLTVSGGEPAWPGHGAFVRDLLREARRRGISTWVETCGVAPWRVYASWLPYLDGVLFDLKGMDPARHRAATGAGNALIHRNAARLAAVPGLQLHLRVPLIPGHNDTPDELEPLAAFAGSLPGPPPLEILPYHTYGVRKYRLLGRPYLLDGLAPDEQGSSRAHAVLSAHRLAVLAP